MANAIAEIANGFSEIANGFSEIANAIAEITNAIAEIANAYTNLKKECDRCVGWVERSETQHIQAFEALGIVPQPNLHL